MFAISSSTFLFYLKMNHILFSLILPQLCGFEDTVIANVADSRELQKRR